MADEYKILVFSDSHGVRRYIREALRAHAGTADAAFHLGDGALDLLETAPEFMPLTVRCVVGNCDSPMLLSLRGFPDVPAEDVAEIGGVRFLMLHGHTRNAKNTDARMIALAEEKHCDAVLYGHTHSEACYYVPAPHDPEKRILVFNPGANKAEDHPYGVIYVKDGQIVASHANGRT